MGSMTKLLEQAVDQARELTAEEQDAAADVLFAHIANRDRHYGLNANQVEEVKRIRERLRSERHGLPLRTRYGRTGKSAAYEGPLIA